MITLALVATGFEALCVVFNWLPGVSHETHVAGAIFGALIGYVLAPWQSEPQPEASESGPIF